MFLLPLRVCLSSQSGTDQTLHKPLQDAVANSFELGENVQYEIGRLSPICEEWIAICCSFFCNSWNLKKIHYISCPKSLFSSRCRLWGEIYGNFSKFRTNYRLKTFSRLLIANCLDAAHFHAVWDWLATIKILDDFHETFGIFTSTLLLRVLTSPICYLLFFRRYELLERIA